MTEAAPRGVEMIMTFHISIPTLASHPSQTNQTILHRKKRGQEKQLPKINVEKSQKGKEKFW
jgi:hypothetical protein